MKVVAGISSNVVLAKITIEELLLLAGFNFAGDFDKVMRTNILDRKGRSDRMEGLVEELVKIEHIPIGDIYKNSKEILTTYEELKTKFDSIRNQLANLLTKMAAAKEPAAPAE